VRLGRARGGARAYPVRTAEPRIASGEPCRLSIVDVLATSRCAMGQSAEDACGPDAARCEGPMREPVQREIVRARTALLKAAIVNLRVHLHVLRLAARKLSSDEMNLAILPCSHLDVTTGTQGKPSIVTKEKVQERACGALRGAPTWLPAGPSRAQAGRSENDGRNAGVLSCSLNLYAGPYRAGRCGASPDGRRFWSSV
jgi:hypothetical protein